MSNFLYYHIRLQVIVLKTSLRRYPKLSWKFYSRCDTHLFRIQQNNSYLEKGSQIFTAQFHWLILNLIFNLSLLIQYMLKSFFREKFIHSISLSDFIQILYYVSTCVLIIQSLPLLIKEINLSCLFQFISSTLSVTRGNNFSGKVVISNTRKL